MPTRATDRACRVLRTVTPLEQMYSDPREATLGYRGVETVTLLVQAFIRVALFPLGFALSHTAGTHCLYGAFLGL